MAILNMTTYAAGLRTMYEDLTELVYTNRPLLGLIPKAEGTVGDSIKVPLRIGNTGGRSATMATAVTNKAASVARAFAVTPVSDYAVASVDRLTMLASANDKGAVMKAWEFEVDGAFNKVTDSLHRGLYLSKGGAVSRVGAAQVLASTTVVLETIADTAYFEVGDKFYLATTAAGTSLRNSGAACTVSAVNRSAGTLTVGANLSTTIAAAAVGDYIILEGDAAARISGLSDWVPFTAPSASESFFGVDRSIDERLYGLRADTSTDGTPIEEALVSMANDLAGRGGSPDLAVMNFKQYTKLVNSLGSKVQYTNVQATGAKGRIADIGFAGIKLFAGRGVIDIVPDHACPVGFTWVLDRSTWELATYGKAPHLFEEDGEMIRDASADSYEVRTGYYGNVICKAPGFNGIIKLPTTGL
jgi:hypothetical protein